MGRRARAKSTWAPGLFREAAGRPVPPALALAGSILLALTLPFLFLPTVQAEVQGLPPDGGASVSEPGVTPNAPIPLADTRTPTTALPLMEGVQPALTVTQPVTVVTPTAVLQNAPPTLPVLIAPPDGAVVYSLSPTLTVAVSDADGDDLTVTFYGRRVYTTTAPDFAIVALPDTQYYSCGSLCGSNPALFITQTQWVVDNRLARNIAFVTHLGDVVEFGDLFESHWQNADAALSLLEIPLLPDWPDGTPYGIAVGNHDQYFGTTLYNQYFGADRFLGRSYYGDHYGADNNNHYDLWSVGDLDFVAVHLEYDESPAPAVLTWADAVLKSYPERRAIVTSHFLIWPGEPGDFGAQGQAIYDELKDNPNLFLMLCGHHTEEGRRADTFQGHTVHTLLSDYQNRANGGDGWLRIMEFSPAGNQIQVRTYSPWLDQYETDADSEFTLPYTMDRSPYEVIAVHEGVPSGSEAAAVWPGLFPATQYEWFVAVADGITATVSPLWGFTTADLEVPIDGLAATNDSPTRLGTPTTLTATVTAGSHITYTWAFGDRSVGAGARVAHVYPGVGVFTAVVTASNPVSEMTATTVVTIAELSYSYTYLPLAVRDH